MEQSHLQQEQTTPEPAEVLTLTEHFREALSKQYLMLVALRNYALGLTDSINIEDFSGPVSVAFDAITPRDAQANLKRWVTYFDENLNDIETFYALAENDFFDVNTEVKILGMCEMLMSAAYKAILATSK